MQNDVTGTSPRPAPDDRPAPLMVVILYDLAEAGRRAMSLLRKATTSPDPGIPIEVRLWRIDIVADPLAARNAEADLASADLLVVALEHRDALTDAGRESLAAAIQWLRGHQAAVALLPGSSPAETARTAFVEDAARAAGAAFLTPRPAQVLQPTPTQAIPPSTPSPGIAAAMGSSASASHLQPRWRNRP